MSKILTTKNYALFMRSDENRPTDLQKRKKLRESMEKYGFLKCFPIVCTRNGDDRLVVKDGQHRLQMAENLGLPVHYVEEKVDFDVAVVNSTARGWTLKDYAEKYRANGVKPYADGLEFSAAHGIPIGAAFALLAGTTTFSNVQESFFSGTFKVKDRAWADAVAGIYGPLVQMAPALKNSRFIEACMAVCRVPGFDGKRLVVGAGKCREKLVPYATRDAYLEMLESLYNFNRTARNLVSLKIEAVKAMRERNIAAPKNGKPTAAA